VSAVRDCIAQVERETIGLHGFLHETQTMLEARLRRIGGIMDEINEAYERETTQLCQSDTGGQDTQARLVELREERSKILLHLTSAERETRKVIDACEEAKDLMRELTSQDSEHLEMEKSSTS
jgi:hypothetical protein